MSSRLETIPRDILQHIAVLVGSSSPLQPPVDLLSLTLTNSTIHASLSPNSAANVYANIFSSMFDPPFILHHHNVWPTNTGLLSELVRRLQLLKRSSRRDLSPRGLYQDLWTAYWMLCESGTRNELQLRNVDFSGFMLDLARYYLPQEIQTTHHAVCVALRKLIVWLLSLSVSRGTLTKLTLEDQEELRNLMFPYMYLYQRVEATGTSYRGKSTTPSPSCPLCRTVGGRRGLGSTSSFSGGRSDVVYLYGEQHTPTLSGADFPAISIFSAIKELRPVLVPTHVRARQNNAAFVGMTKEDVDKMGAYKTPLFADSMPDVPFAEPQTTMPRGILDGTLLGTTLSAYMDTDKGYTLGSMTGLWNGTFYGVSQASNGSAAVGGYRKALQCNIVEYFSVGQSEKSTSNDFCYRNCSEFNLGDRKYRKFLPSVDPVLSLGLSPNTIAPQAVTAPDPSANVILMGETLRDHDNAWGGYYFTGTVDPMGNIKMRRESKGLGDVHYFEGRVIFGNAFVGRCGISTDGISQFAEITEQMNLGRFAYDGAFSLTKVSESS